MDTGRKNNLVACSFNKHLLMAHCEQGLVFTSQFEGPRFNIAETTVSWRGLPTYSIKTEQH